MISRRSFFSSSAAAGTVIVRVGAVGKVAQAALVEQAARGIGDARPDVLFLLTDQWNPYCLGYAGDTSVSTPNLDRLAAEGVVFDNCYTPCPVCMPARVSLLTGRYPHNHQLWSNNTDYYVPPDIAPMFRDIHAAGYTTAQIGKLHWTGGDAWQRHFDSLDGYYKALGLDYCQELATPFSTPSGSGPYQEHLRRIGKLDAYCRDIAERIEKGQYVVRPSAVAPEDHNDTFVARAGIDFLRKQPVDKPYCLAVSFPGPHPPLDAPGRYASSVAPDGISFPVNVPQRFVRDGVAYDRKRLQEARANYYGKMALIDDNIGQIIDTLKKRGKWDNTLVIFSSDHGEMIGAHGLFSKGRFYEESARVPLLMRWPKHIPAGRRSGALAAMFDVYPTIVEAIGGKLSSNHFATSLLPVAIGQKETVRDAAFSEISNRTNLNYMARTSRFVWWTHGGAEALYDMRNDPYQMRNLVAVASHREDLHEMRARHHDYLRSTQVNLSASYRPMLDRMTDEGGGKKEGLAERLYQQFRRTQGLDNATERRRR